MESFFALLRKNILDRQAWTTREQLWIAIVTWTERAYQRCRRRARRRRLTPIEYETIMKPSATRAAQEPNCHLIMRQPRANTIQTIARRPARRELEILLPSCIDVISSSMANGTGFWSYVHADDDAEGGRVSQLARDVVAQFEMLTGDSINLFLDRDELKWGEDWKISVDESLASVAFFIPVITPRYFQSPECRRELNYFARRAQRLGLEELIMPILYVEFPSLHEDPSGDESIDMVKRYQWEDWTDLRYESTISPDYRRAVSRMAERLAQANIIADEVDIAQAVDNPLEEEDDAPGSVDLMAQAESALPEWMETLGSIGQQIEEVGNIFVSGKSQIEAANAKPKAFAARLIVFRSMAAELRGPSASIFDYSERFTKQLNEVDQGITVIIKQIPEEVVENPELKEDACEFFDLVRKLSDSADEGLGTLKQMIDVIEPIEHQSRDLRPPMKLMRRGLTSMHEGRKVINGWVDLIEQSGLECDR